MKIAIGYKIRNTPWGGGNQFATSLFKAAKDKGFKIVFDLKDKNIDVILLTDPRSYNSGIEFGSIEIINYLLFKNKNAIVVHRINECDERKNTNYMNKFLRWSNYCADHTVFISSWLKNLNIYQKGKESTVILNGADQEIFRPSQISSWDQNCPLKIVTHHWSPNFMKGFDVYRDIDNLLTTSEWESKIDFTYIGNLPKGFAFKKAKHLMPMQGAKLGLELSKHHVYLSASLNEPAGMHHIEGALCGLPLIYRESGALPEYCGGFGTSFKGSNYLIAIEDMMKNYSFYKGKVLEYPNNSIKMNNQYFQLFEKLLNKREQIVANRSLFNSPILLLINFLFLFLKLNSIVRFVGNLCWNNIFK